MLSSVVLAKDNVEMIWLRSLFFMIRMSKAWLLDAQGVCVNAQTDGKFEGTLLVNDIHMFGLSEWER